MIEFMRAAGILVVVLAWVLVIEGTEKRWKHAGSIVAVFLSVWAMEEIKMQAIGATTTGAYASEVIFLLVIPTLITHYLLKKELSKAVIPSAVLAAVYYAKDYLPGLIG
tara:strand:+ start:930 stop:1256 length:327 start_codon:yes stop_codon:yes gene_type:complete